MSDDDDYPEPPCPNEQQHTYLAYCGACYEVIG